MKKIILILISILCLFSVNAVEVLSETVINKEDVVSIYKDEHTAKPKYFMIYYYNGKKNMASISKSEVQKYLTAVKYDVDFQIIVQQLKTKKRVIIRV